MTKIKPVWTSNTYLSLKHPFTLIQKRVLHFVIANIKMQEELYKKMKANVEFKKDPDYIAPEPTLYGDCYFTIPVKKIDPLNKDRNIRVAIKGLMIDISDANNIENFLLKGTRVGGTWRLMFPERSVNFLTEISKGVTPLGSVLYLSAQSVYTAIFYEFCMKWRNVGIAYQTREELLDLVHASDSYRKNFSRVRLRMLEPAMTELKELFYKKQSEVYFTYTEVKKGNSTQALEYHIVYADKKVNTDDKDTLNIQYITRTLTEIMVDNIKEKKYKTANLEFVKKAVNTLQGEKLLDKFAEKLEKRVMQKHTVPLEGKGALARYILENDFNIE